MADSTTTSTTGSGASGTTDTNKYFKAFDPSNPTADLFNYEAFLGDVSDTANKTRQVTDVAMPKISGSLAKDSRVQAAVNQFNASKETLGKQAENAAKAIEMKGAATANTMRQLTALQNQTTTQNATASDLYGKAAKAADEYVSNVAARSQASLNRLDELYKEMGTNRDFSKAHTLQAGVQATIGGMQEEGRAIAERYGSDSAEYREFTQRKQKSLATMSSNIQAIYQQFQETQDQNYLAATTETMYRADQYASYADQTRVETLLAIAQQSNAYDLQSTQMQVSLATLKDTALSGMADYISASPVFSMDLSSLVSIISDVAAEQEAKRQAIENERIANEQLKLQQQAAYDQSPEGRRKATIDWMNEIGTRIFAPLH